ncbi:hypothetical protein AAMO2058_001696800 [Amorphochlora amoebiformis]
MTGPLSPVQLSSLSKYPLIILGWQHQIWWSNFSRISHAQLSELRKIKSMYPTTKTYAYLPLSWAPPMWENIRNIVTDPSICQRSGRFYDYFLQSRAKEEGGGGEGLPECVRGDREEHPLYSDTFCGQVLANASLERCRSLYWNFANQESRNYILSSVVAPIIDSQQPFLDGVFFDGVDFAEFSAFRFNITNIPGSPSEQGKVYWEGITKWTTKAVSLLSSKKLKAMLSIGQNSLNFFHTEGSKDENRFMKQLTRGGWVRYYEFVRGENPFPVLPNIIREGELGMSVVIHVYLERNVSAPDLTDHIALFLIAREEGFYFMASTGWLDADWTWHAQYDLEYGQPVEKPQKIFHNESGSQGITYSRRYTKCNVSLKCSSIDSDDCKGAIDFLDF